MTAKPLKKPSTVCFSAVILKEGVNPYVDTPIGAGKVLGAKGTIPVVAQLDGKNFKANLVPLGLKRGFASGSHHRLYLNAIMRTGIGKETGDKIRVFLTVDRAVRTTPMVPVLAQALKKDATAKKVFDKLSPSHRKELLRYLGFLKSKEALQRNVKKVMKHLRDPKVTWFGKTTSKYHS